MIVDQQRAQAGVSNSGFDAAVEAYRQALEPYLKGDPRPVTAFFSRRDDVTLANPLGPPVRGPADVDDAIAEGASYLRDGSVRHVEEISRFNTSDLGYVVQIERAQARLRGSDEMTPHALRTTMIFRREGDTWQVVHRHADPITTRGSIATTIEK